MNPVRFTFQNKNGKYFFFAPESVLLEIFQKVETFNDTNVDAKSGKVINLKDEISEALKIETPKE